MLIEEQSRRRDPFVSSAFSHWSHGLRQVISWLAVTLHKRGSKCFSCSGKFGSNGRLTELDVKNKRRHLDAIQIESHQQGATQRIHTSVCVQSR